MTLSSELLPAMQHYALFAAALALFSLSLTHVKKRFGIWVWFLVVVPPVAQITWSLWETISEVVAVESHAAWRIVVQVLAHGVAILFVSVVVLYMASRSRDDLPRRVRLEPTIGPRRQVEDSE